MATTTLFVEILVIGTISEIWLFLFLFLFISFDSNTITFLIDSIYKLSALLIIPYLAFTYCLGWLINFVSERLFKPFFQKKYRDELFTNAGFDYYEARGLLFQKASSDVIQDFRFDRHILRISRSSVINFSLITVALLFNCNRISTPTLLLCVSVSISFVIVSFFQWMARYKSNYSKMLGVYKVVKEEKSQLINNNKKQSEQAL